MEHPITVSTVCPKRECDILEVFLHMLTSAHVTTVRYAFEVLSSFVNYSTGSSKEQPIKPMYVRYKAIASSRV